MSGTPRIPLSWEEYDTLTHDDVRGEYIDGELWVDYPTPDPERAADHRVAMTLRAAFGHDAVVKTDAGWRLGAGEFGPDLVAYGRQDEQPLLAVDVMPVDPAVRSGAYAAAGMPRYWIVDLDGPTLTVYELVGGECRLVGEFGADDEADLDVGPTRLRVRPGDLLR